MGSALSGVLRGVSYRPADYDSEASSLGREEVGDVRCVSGRPMTRTGWILPTIPPGRGFQDWKIRWTLAAWDSGRLRI